MTRRAVVNVACGQWYPAGQERLFYSLEERGENTTRLFWRDQLPPNCPTHEEAPYAFKPYAFSAAHALGFDQAIWLDASVWAVRTLDDLWARVDEDGWYLEADGHMVGEWINDRALQLLDLTRDQAMEIPLIEGKVIGLDFRNPRADGFLDWWMNLVADGGFAGAWTNDTGSESADRRCRGHRHDIACASPIVEQLGMRLQPFKRLAFPADGDPGDEIVLMAQGL